MKLLILISYLALVYCRPQSSTGNRPPGEFETEQPIELMSSTQTISRTYGTKEVDLTHDILRKIEQINQKHGYTTRNPLKTEFKLLPHFYTYSHQHPKPFRKIINTRKGNEQMENINMYARDGLPEHYADDIGGQRIKRKITHQQNYFLPQAEPIVQHLMVVPVLPSYPVQPYNRYNYPKQIDDPSYNKNDDNSMNYLGQQMVDNLKDIILKSQLPPNIEGVTFNPLVQSLPRENSFVQYRKPDLIYGHSGYINNIPNMPWNVYQYEGYSPYKEIEPSPLRTNTPMTMYNSLTTITEYEDEENCKTCNQIHGSKLRSEKALLFPNLKQQRYTVNIDKSIEVAAFTEHNKPTNTVVHIEKEHEKNLHNLEGKSLLDSETDELNINRNEKVRKTGKPSNNDNKENEKTVLNPLQLLIQNQPNKNKPIKPVSVNDDINKDLINDNNKKVLSKDNTGSGIFIHRLKVRKGGVAIAGPGGIATAGSGGTAIVGPNGFAYTHPDSLAIAGSGSKVIAVDPKINLGDIVRGKEDGSRVGRVVAVGPVIYYNRG